VQVFLLSFIPKKISNTTTLTHALEELYAGCNHSSLFLRSMTPVCTQTPEPINDRSAAIFRPSNL
jgi:hypothetical protein